MSLQALKPVEVSFKGKSIRVLPAVCAEALQLNSPTDSYDIVVVVAYNNGIEPFIPTIKQNTQNQVPVIFCNDGQFGFSSINVVTDHRMTGVWWWGSPNNGHLPPGDAILVADIHLDRLAAQFGVTNPSPPASLIKLAPVIAEQGSSNHLQFAKELDRISEITDCTVQTNLLEGCLQQLHLTPVQRAVALQMKRLTLAGTANNEWWNTLGSYCSIAGAEDLSDLESQLATKCVEAADTLLLRATSEDDVILGKIARFRRQCLERCRPKEDLARAMREAESTPLDRVDETKEIRNFLDSTTERVLLVSGLDDVGKQTAVRLAFSQSGRKAIAWIELPDDATLDYLGAALAKHFGLGYVAGQNQGVIVSDSVIERIPLGATIVLSQAENLRDHGNWREPNTPTALARFVTSLSTRKCKLIVVSSSRVEIDTNDTRHVKRMWIKGLPAEHATLLLDQQIRRVGMDPTHFDSSDRQKLALSVGNHPGAIMLVADYIEQDGFSIVFDDLQRRTGVHTQVVRRILKRLTFSQYQQLVIALLSECRVPIPVDVLSKICPFNPMPVVQSLIQQCVIERHRNDHIALTDLIRGFADITEVEAGTSILFHKAVAERFAALSGENETVEELNWAIESRFHADMAGDPNLAARVPGLIDGMLGAARELVDRQQYEQARPIVDRLLSTHKSAELFQLAALIYARLGNCDMALSLAKEALSADASRTWIVTEVGRLSLHVHRLDIASDCINLVRRSGHDSSYLATLEGKIALRQSGESTAVASFQRAVDLAEADPGRRDAWPHFFLGRTLLKLGRTEEAISVLYSGELIASERKQRNRRLLIAIRTQLAIGYVFNKDYQQAKRILDLVASDETGNPEVVWAFALYRSASVDVQGSQDLAQATLKELNPMSAKDRHGRCQVYLFRALIYLGIGNSQKASEEFSFAHREDPRNVFVLLRWANTLLELARESSAEGEPRAARICAEQAKSLADKVCEFDRSNAQALEILETLSDEFNVS